MKPKRLRARYAPLRGSTCSRFPPSCARVWRRWWPRLPRASRAPISKSNPARSMSQLIYKADVIARARRLVVKVGSAVLSDAEGLRADVIEGLAREVDTIAAVGARWCWSRRARSRPDARCWRCKARFIDRRAPGRGRRRADRADDAWAKAFAAHGRIVAQLLLTHQDLAERKRRLNARGDDRDAARGRRDSDRQRERHRRGRGNPARRQRHAFLTGGEPGPGRSARNPERRGGRAHRRSAQAPRRTPDSADCGSRGRDARAGGRERRTAGQRRDGDQAQGGAAGGAGGNSGGDRGRPRPGDPERGARSGARMRHADCAGSRAA